MNAIEQVKNRVALQTAAARMQCQAMVNIAYFKAHGQSLTPPPVPTVLPNYPFYARMAGLRNSDLNPALPEDNNA